jgi:hypothetical protein
VGDYIADAMAVIAPQETRKRKPNFGFSKELEGVESFSADLFKEYRNLLASRLKRTDKLYIMDSLDPRLIEINL